jgi:hypothetical protein
MTMQRHVKLFRLPEATKTEGLRQLKTSDVPQACQMLNEVRDSRGRGPISYIFIVFVGFDETFMSSNCNIQKQCFVHTCESELENI